MIKTIVINTFRQGLHAITDSVMQVVNAAKLGEGLCTLYMPHTSASLLIQENYDPSAQADLEAWMNRLVPENDSLYTHILEGDDDMPAHIKASLTAVSLSIPFSNDALMLGAWQGIYIWEHRKAGSNRDIIIHLST
ncbi:MAG: secondary thiamine-phosphate synthase enzyme [Cellvibrionaceae bacterium]|jgi:secondary thiamine-phosphate synthase enzyme